MEKRKGNVNGTVELLKLLTGFYVGWSSEKRRRSEYLLNNIIQSEVSTKV